MNSSKHPNKADIRVKYTWMKEKYNWMVDIGKRKEFLESLKNNGEYELFEFYKDLKKINPTANSKLPASRVTALR